MVWLPFDDEKAQSISDYWTISDKVVIIINAMQAPLAAAKKNYQDRCYDGIEMATSNQITTRFYNLGDFNTKVRKMRMERWFVTMV